MLNWSEIFESVFWGFLQSYSKSHQYYWVFPIPSWMLLRYSYLIPKSLLGNGGESQSTDENVVFRGSLSHGRHLRTLLPSSPPWDCGYFPRAWNPSSHPLWFTGPFRSVFLSFNLLQIFVAVFFSISLLFICWGRGTRTRAPTWRSEDNSLRVASLSYHMGSGNQTWISRLGGKPLYPPSHLVGP